MDDRIKEHLQQLNKYYLHLEEMRKLKREVFIQDAVFQGAAERFLQLAIESCLNIGNRILALQQSPCRLPDCFIHNPGRLGWRQIWLSL